MFLSPVVLYGQEKKAEDKTKVEKMNPLVLLRCSSHSTISTAICIDASGLYLTTNSALKVLEKKKKLSLHFPPSRDYKGHAFQILGRDTELDLVLLKVDTDKILTANPIASAEDIYETMEVVAPGFQFNRKIRGYSARRFPKKESTSGTIVSIGNKSKSGERLTLNFSVPPSYLGGPVLDSKGALAGIITETDSKRNTTFAVSPKAIHRFLENVFVECVEPAMSANSLGKAALFQVKSFGIQKALDAINIKLQVKAEGEKVRSYDMEREGNEFKVNAPLYAGNLATSKYATVVFYNGSIIGRVNNSTIKVGDNYLALKDIRTIDFIKNVVLLDSGKKNEGAISGFKELKVKSGDVWRNVQLEGAKSIELAPLQDIPPVNYSVIVYSKGKEVQRIEGQIATKSSRFVRPIKVDPRSRDSSDRPYVLSLNETIRSLDIGKAGTYMVLHLPESQRLAVVDMFQQKIIHYIALETKDVIVAAGAKYFLIANNEKKYFKRWDYKNYKGYKYPFKRFKINYSVQTMTIGFDSNTMFLSTSESKHLIDIRYMKNKKVTWEGPAITKDDHVRASADGKIFSIFRGDGSTGGVSVYELDGSTMKYRHKDVSSGPVVPNDDGRVLFSSLGAIHNSLNSEFSMREKDYRFIPVYGSPNFLVISIKSNPVLKVRSTKSKFFPVMIFRRCVSNLNASINADKGVAYDFTFDKHIFANAKASVIAVIPSSQKSIMFQHYEFELLSGNEIETETKKVLLITSLPELHGGRGTKYNYQVSTSQDESDLQYRLDSAPLGMRISDKGLITWDIPLNFKLNTFSVILMIIEDTGHEVYYIFKIEIQ